MPRRPQPLPAALAGAIVLSRDAHAAGVSADRLRARDLRAVTRGARRRVADVPGRWEDLGHARPVVTLPPEEAAVVVRLTGGVASHLTALRLHRMVEPWWLGEDGHLHVSRPHARGRSVRPGVVSHARSVPDEDVVEVHGIPVTSLERTWVDLCSLLRPGQVREAVVAGDGVVNRPWVEGERRAARTTVPELRAALARAGRYKGVRTARAALDLVRVGADSPRETELRLALADAGLPEPRLQVTLRSVAGEVTDADMLVEEARVALHYDGEHHRSADQQARDARRDRLWQEAGHLSLTVTTRDRREDFRAVLAAVARRRGTVASTPGLSSGFPGEWTLSSEV